MADSREEWSRYRCCMLRISIVIVLQLLLEVLVAIDNLAVDVDEIIDTCAVDQVAENARQRILAEVADQVAIDAVAVEDAERREPLHPGQVPLHHVRVLVHLARLRHEARARLQPQLLYHIIFIGIDRLIVTIWLGGSCRCLIVLGNLGELFHLAFHLRLLLVVRWQHCSRLDH